MDVSYANHLTNSSIESIVGYCLYKREHNRKRKKKQESHCYASQDTTRPNVEQKNIDKNKPKSSLKCKRCRKRFSQESIMIEHMNEPKYQCQNCRQIFCLEVGLNRHIATVHGQPVYSCSICQFKSNNTRTLTDHFIRKHAEDGQSLCKEQLETQNDRQQRTNRVRSDEPSISCSICGHVCKNVHALKVHMKHQHYKPEYVCEICRRSLATQKTFEQHLKWHETKGDVQCPTCHKKCRSWDLKQHMQTHSSAKPFSCPVCSKLFRWRYAQEQHTLGHTGTRPYICTVCSLAFARKRCLVVHRRKHPEPLPPLPVVSVRNIIAEFMKEYRKENAVSKRK